MANKHDKWYKVEVNLNYHHSPEEVYLGKCWTVVSRTYDDGKPTVHDRDCFGHLGAVTRNRFEVKLQKEYGVDVLADFREITNSKPCLLWEYESYEQLTQQEKDLYQEVEWEWDKVLKRSVLEEVLVPVTNKRKRSTVLN